MADYEVRFNQAEVERWQEARDAYVKWKKLQTHFENQRKIAKARAVHAGATHVKFMGPDGTVLEHFNV